MKKCVVKGKELRYYPNIDEIVSESLMVDFRILSDQDSSTDTSSVFDARPPAVPFPRRWEILTQLSSKKEWCFFREKLNTAGLYDIISANALIIFDFYVVFLAARAATEKHDEYYHKPSGLMIV